MEEVGDGNQVIITKRGVPKAALVNFEELQTLEAVAFAAIWLSRQLMILAV